MRQHPSTSRTPILLVGQTPVGAAELRACRALGSVDAIPHLAEHGPLDVDALHARLEMLIGQHRTMLEIRHEAEHLERSIRQRTAALGLEVEERVHAEQSLKRHVTHLEMKAALAQALDRATHPEAALLIAVEMVLKVFTADRVTAVVRSRQGCTIVAQTARHEAWRIPIDATLDEAAMQAILDADPAVVHMPAERLPREVGGLPLRSRTAVAVKPARGEACVLVLDHVQFARASQEDDTELLCAIARRVAYTLTLLQANRDLHDSEHGLRALAEALPHLVWTAEAPGADSARFEVGARFERVKSGWRDYAGLAPDACLGVGWLRLVHPEDLPQVQDWLAQAVRNVKPLAV